MSEQTHIGTIAEALNRSIADLERLAHMAGPETPVGFALVSIKVNLQRFTQGVPVDRDHWLSVAAALRRAQGGSP